MSRTYRALTTLALGLALAATTAATAGAAEDVNGQRKALYQSEMEQNLAGQAARSQAARTEAAVERARALERQAGERNLGPVPVVTLAPQPVPSATGRDVDLVAIALLALVGGLIGGAAATAGWTAASRRRHRVVAA
jgi:hypothetical protein